METGETNTEWTERQRREVEFYHDYARVARVEHIDFSPVQGKDSRPWNPYWYVFESACARLDAANSANRLLDYGCGMGVASIRLARKGFQVDGFDISADNLKVAEDLARRYQVAERCRFRVMAAERLEYPDNSFDVIVGLDILHHVDIPLAIAEAHRVLRPGGVAYFKEFVDVPAFDRLRNTRVVRKLVPAEASLEHHITEDERKLTQPELALIRQKFARVDEQRFTILTRLDRLLPRHRSNLRSKLQRADHWIMRHLPALRRLGGTVVLTCEK